VVRRCARQTSVVYARCAVLVIRARKPVGFDEVFERVGMRRASMRQVANVGFEERHPARRVDGFEHERGARTKHTLRSFEKSQEIRGLEMFDDLNGDERTDTRLRLPLQESDGVGLFDIESSVPAQLDHGVIGIDSSRLYSMLPQELQQFAASTAHVE